MYEKDILSVIRICFLFSGCSKTIDIDDYASIEEQANAIREMIGIQTPKISISRNVDITLDSLGYITMVGSVENVGKVDVDNFKIVIDFKDENGKVLDSTYTYNRSTLKIGAEQKFEISHKWNDRYKGYAIRIEYN